MKRGLVACLGALVMVGCVAGHGPVDLVYGPQRIAPPQTGAARTNRTAQGPRGPYYPNAPNSSRPAGASQPASQPLPSAPAGNSNAVPPSNSPYVPPDGSFDYRGSTPSGGQGSDSGSAPASQPASGSSQWNGPGSSSPTTSGSSARPGVIRSSSVARSSGWKPAGTRRGSSGPDSQLFVQRQTRAAEVEPVGYAVPVKQ